MMPILAVGWGTENTSINASARERLLTFSLARAHTGSKEACFASAVLAGFRQEKCFGFLYTPRLA
jgi:hypothetical protein